MGSTSGGFAGLWGAGATVGSLVATERVSALDFGRCQDLMTENPFVAVDIQAHGYGWGFSGSQGAKHAVGHAVNAGPCVFWRVIRFDVSWAGW